MSKRRHLSRLAAPRTWPVKRKLSKWIAKPMPGAHNQSKSMPLVVILRDLLKVAPTSKEIKKLLNARAILINNRVVREVKFAVGLFDVISIPAVKVYYRIIINSQGKLAAIKIPEADATKLLLRIDNKHTIAKDKIQLNFSNGWNLLVKKDEYKTNDVIVFDSKNRKIINKLTLGKDSPVYLIGGKHVGMLAKFAGARETGTLRKHKIAKVIADKNELESSIENLMVVGDKKPVISLNEN